MPPVIVRYPLDPTGISPNNLVQGEVHTLTKRLNRTVVPLYGAFFAESMRIVDQLTQLPLARDLQWYPGELYEVPTALYGKDIYALLVITDVNVSDNVIIQYQAVGGEWGSSETAIAQLLENLNLDDRPVTWPNIVAKPNSFPPSLHLHDAGDVYGFEYVVHAIDRLRSAIEFGDDVSHDQIYKYIDAKCESFRLEMLEMLETYGGPTGLSGTNDFFEDEVYFLKDNFTQFSSDNEMFFMTQERL